MFYRLVDPRVVSGLVVSSGLTPTDRPGCFSASQSSRQEYLASLEESCLNDPVWDELVLPSYRMLYEAEGWKSFLWMEVSVSRQPADRIPVFRIEQHAG